MKNLLVLLVVIQSAAAFADSNKGSALYECGYNFVSTCRTFQGNVDSQVSNYITNSIQANSLFDAKQQIYTQISSENSNLNPSGCVYKVEDLECKRSVGTHYAFSGDTHGQVSCFLAADDGRIPNGSGAVDDQLCYSSFKYLLDSQGGYSCFPVDQFGNQGYSTVDDSRCRGQVDPDASYKKWMNVFSKGVPAKFQDFSGPIHYACSSLIGKNSPATSASTDVPCKLQISDNSGSRELIAFLPKTCGANGDAANSDGETRDQILQLAEQYDWKSVETSDGLLTDGKGPEVCIMNWKKSGTTLVGFQNCVLDSQREGLRVCTAQ